MFPTMRYHRTDDARVITSPEELAALGSDWADSPAAFGIETAPGVKPDPKIAKNRKAPKPAPAAPLEQK